MSQTAPIFFGLAALLHNVDNKPHKVNNTSL